MELYARCPPAKMAEQLCSLGGAKHVVALPPHVQRGCARFSGLQEPPLDRLTLALAALALALALARASPSPSTSPSPSPSPNLNPNQESQPQP